MKLELGGAGVAWRRMVTAKEVFGDWRLGVFWLAMVVAGVIAGFALGWSWRDRPGSLASVRILDVLVAIGTIGAVIAAIAVPMYQNWQRRREIRVNQLLKDWALSEEMHRISGRLRAISQILQSSYSIRPVAELERLKSQLELAKQSTTDRFGRLLIQDLFFQCGVLLDEFSRRSMQLSTGRATGTAVHFGPLDEVTQDAINRIEGLHEQIYRWMERVIVGFDAVGLEAPSVFKSAGKSTMRMHATGEGRVVRG